MDNKVPTFTNSRICVVRNFANEPQVYEVYEEWAKVDDKQFSVRIPFMLHEKDGYACTTYEIGEPTA